MFSSSETDEQVIDFISLLDENNVVRNKDQEITLTFDEKVFNFPEMTIRIKDPFKITAKKLVITCKNFLIHASGTMENTEIIGNLLIHATSVILNQCKVHHSNSDTNGIIYIQDSLIRLNGCEVYDGDVPGIFVEDSIGAYLDNCYIHDVNHTLVAASKTEIFKVTNCKLENSPHNGIHSYQTPLEISNTQIYGTKYPAISVFNKKCSISNVVIKNIEQNAISIDSSPEAIVKDCNIDQVQATAISASRESQGKFYNNTFTNIGGNCFHISESSKAEIYNNNSTNSSYPVFAILMNCEATIHDNKVTNCDLSGGCFRNAKNVEFYNNTLTTVKDCGLSISDTEYAKIHNNTFDDCKVAGIEAYNNSTADIESNTITNTGQCVFYSYAGATIRASNNNIKNVVGCLARLTSHGNGYFTYNEIKECSTMMEGPTTGVYFFENNQGFENVTNNPQLATTKIKLENKYVNEQTAFCFKCNKNKRDTYLYPCGHKVYCKACAEETMKDHGSCPLCRFPVDNISTGYDINDDKENLCIICGDHEIDSIVLPCGHIGFCSGCLQKWLTEHTDCPFCRASPVSYKKIVELD